MNKPDDFGVIECAVSKCRGILFVVSELHKVERQVFNRELEGFALWCVSDLLDDAAEALGRLQQVEVLTEK